VTFPANAELTAKVTAELKTTQSDFPLVVNDYVAGFISYFSNSPAGHAHLLRSLERAGKYKEMIRRICGIRVCHRILSIWRSRSRGFSPGLNARSGAGGMWQFMPTGRLWSGAKRVVRRRFDPEKSSLAYAKYMKTLYNQFGDWYLAMAAYDWGPGNVQRAVMRTGYAGCLGAIPAQRSAGRDEELCAWIIAAIIMAKNPEQYGLDKIVPDTSGGIRYCDCRLCD